MLVDENEKLARATVAVNCPRLLIVDELEPLPTATCWSLLQAVLHNAASDDVIDAIHTQHAVRSGS